MHSTSTCDVWTVDRLKPATVLQTHWNNDEVYLETMSSSPATIHWEELEHAFNKSTAIEPSMSSTATSMQLEAAQVPKHEVSKHFISAVLAPQPLKFLYEMTGPESLAEVISCYLTEAVKHVQAISTAIAQEDAVALAQAASTLESSSAFLGANVLSNLCKEFEAMGRAKTTQIGAKRLPQLKAECERVKIALQAHLLQAQLQVGIRV